MATLTEVFSVGHSNQELSEFLALLGRHSVRVLVDVRSHPRSISSPQFDGEALARSLKSAGIRYVHVPELGGRPHGTEFYDAKGHVLYAKLATTKEFRRGAQFLLESDVPSIAIMCAEEDPTACHRRLLVGRYLESMGMPVKHLRRDGQVLSETQLREKGRDRIPEGQEQLMNEEVRVPRKSIPSVLRKKPRTTSSSRLDAPEFDGSSTSE